MAKKYKFKTEFEVKFGRDHEVCNMQCSLKDIIHEWDDNILELRIKHYDSYIDFPIKKSDLLEGEVTWSEDGEFIFCNADFLAITEISAGALREVRANDQCWFVEVLASDVAEGFLFIDGEYNKKENIFVEII